MLMAFASSAVSQTKWPATFLWKISKPGEQTPSYLYGTIHLQDKRLFNFSDSVYAAIERSEGFALEFDVQQFMDSMFNGLSRTQKEEELSKIKVDLGKSGESASTRAILKEMKMDGRKLSKKDLKKIRDHRMQKLVQEGEMPTVVDGFLYGIAQRRQKIISGLEDPQDTEESVDEMGAALTPDETFQSEARMRAGLEWMIRVYARKDLQAIADSIVAYRDEELERRNVKMSRRIDSLMNLRSMFFAIGAAHLPGETGVISLLRQKGFVVEPVFSRNETPGATYLAGMGEMPWQKNDEAGFIVETPGKVTEVDRGSITMKAYLDLSSMLFYAFATTSSSYKTFADLQMAFKNATDKAGAYPASIKSRQFNIEGNPALEGSFQSADGQYRVQFILKKRIMHLLIAGTQPGKPVASSEIDRFFHSFHFVQKPNESWKDTSFANKGLRIALPGTFKSRADLNKAAEGSVWTFNSYDYFDESSGLYYLLQIRDVNPGNFVEGDTSFVSAYRQSLTETMQDVRVVNTDDFRGWPGFRIESKSIDSTMVFHIQGVVKGNRVFIFAAGGAIDSDFTDAERHFASVQLSEQAPMKFASRSEAGFRTLAPAPFFQADTDSTDSPGSSTYYSYDSTQLVSYSVTRVPFYPHYWVDNDSVFFARKMSQFRSEGDSVIEEGYKNNGKHRTYEFILKTEGNSIVKRYRLLVNGDSLYTISVFIPATQLHQEEQDRFFDEFVVEKKTGTSIYTNQLAALLAALKTNDSTLHAKLKNSLLASDILASDLPLIQNALLEEYPGFGNDDETIHDILMDKAKEFADGRTVEFVKQHYSKNDLSEKKKYDLLDLLATVHTDTAYQLFADLVTTHIPKDGAKEELYYVLDDSLELSARLYPAILSGLRDSLFAETVVRLAEELIDSNLLKVEVVKAFEKQIIDEAAKRMELIKAEPDNWYLYTHWTGLLEQLNSPSSNQLLKQFALVPEVYTNHNAALGLIRNGQKVSPAVIEKLAKDKRTRLSFYEELKKLGQEKLMPSAWTTAVKLAESELYEQAVDEGEVTISFVGEKLKEFMGSRQKFYLFKIVYTELESENVFLGIAGPYPAAGTAVFTARDATGIFWDENFSASKLDAHLKTYLGEIAVYLKESSEASK